MRLLYFSDAHLRATTPKNRKDDYPQEMQLLFEQITELIHDHDIQAILNGGDLFDTPDPAQSILNEYAEVFTAWDKPIYSIIGSHDKFGYNDATLHRTALGTLVATGLIEIIDDTKWIDKNCQIAGVSHSYSLDDSPSNYKRERFTDDYMIQICHGMLVDTPFFGKYTLISDVSTDADLVISGHVHSGYGPITIGKTEFVNIGSLGRTDRVARKYDPGVILIDTDVPTWIYVPLDCKPDKDIFSDNIAIEKTQEMDLTEFISTLRDKIVGLKEHKNVKDIVIMLGRESGYSEDIIECAVSYIEKCMIK